MVQAPQVEIGWFEKIKNSLNADSIAQKLHLSKHKLFDIALFFGVGFLCGFFWKRYANYFIALLLFVAALIILQQLDLLFIKINWVKIQECCGIETVATDADLTAVIWSWIKLNVVVIFSFIIGFCFGSRLS